MLLWYFIFNLLFHVSHPIHIAKCQMEHNPQSNKLEITLHVFLDDLETSMRNAGAPKLNLGTKKEIDSIDAYLIDYLNQHFQIEQQQTPVQLNWIGKELSDDLFAYWCYFESEPLQSKTTLDVRFDLLMDLYRDQQNILSFVNSKNKSMYALCNTDKTTCQFELYD